MKPGGGSPVNLVNLLIREGSPEKALPDNDLQAK
jgi:hypothetical protein